MVAEVRETWFTNPSCPPDCSVILGKLLNFFELQFFYLQNGDDSRTSYLG